MFSHSLSISEGDVDDDMPGETPSASRGGVRLGEKGLRSAPVQVPMRRAERARQDQRLRSDSRNRECEEGQPDELRAVVRVQRGAEELGLGAKLGAPKVRWADIASGREGRSRSRWS